MSRLIALGLLGLAVIASAQRQDGQFWPCSPMTNKTACPPNPGLNTQTYRLDFTTTPNKPDRWTSSNYATINYNSPNQGAAFTISKAGDSPQLWTDFYIHYGRIDVDLQCSPGTGIISSAVLISDVFDEIDWEWSGNNFGNPAFSRGQVQNNYFGKGITGNYDRGVFVDVAAPQSSVHRYSLDWSAERLVWEIDGKPVRTLLAKDANARGAEYQYPQTPSKVQLGTWAGGAPGMNAGTVSWAGGATDFKKGPFSMYVRRISITNANPAAYYNYTDRSGKSDSVRKLAGLPDEAVSRSVSGMVSAKPSETVHPKPAGTGAATTAVGGGGSGVGGSTGSTGGTDQSGGSGQPGSPGGTGQSSGSGESSGGDKAGSNSGSGSTGGPTDSGISHGDEDGLADDLDDEDADGAAPGGSGAGGGSIKAPESEDDDEDEDEEDGEYEDGIEEDEEVADEEEGEMIKPPDSIIQKPSPSSSSSSSTSRPGATAPTKPLVSSTPTKPTSGKAAGAVSSSSKEILPTKPADYKTPPADPKKPPESKPPANVGYSIWNLWGAGSGSGGSRLAKMYKEWTGRVEGMGGWNDYLRREGGIVGVVRDVERGFVRGGW